MHEMRGLSVICWLIIELLVTDNAVVDCSQYPMLLPAGKVTFCLGQHQQERRNEKIRYVVKTAESSITESSPERCLYEVTENDATILKLPYGNVMQS